MTIAFANGIRYPAGYTISLLQKRKLLRGEPSLPVVIGVISVITVINVINVISLITVINVISVIDLQPTRCATSYPPGEIDARLR
jgi:hypothetical protein